MNQMSTTAQITRQNIIDAFWQLYCKKTIEKITVKEVCQVAGYNRSTFYVYFKDVYEILEVIEENTVTAEDFETSILKQVYQYHASQKHIIMYHLLQFFENNKKYLPVLLSENGDPKFRQKILKKLRPIVFASFRELTDEEIAKADYIMEYQSAAVLNTIAKWYNNGKDIPLKDFIDLLISITTNGIQSELLKYRK
ncbi:TetR/AcrR family transcriptional regulator [Anaeromicropila herbilytica]|uniref:HTH tetR-type domain-containing protein n=1 Tax=Anaeromicropila herbilytica TaxID=2785025 RepID=A0A7R7IC01_9FIRM|nr:TetR/AcrR family transcriptional regulator [Anaeromicropila herbilytica]BCN30198.1 hypothetical protein bsdtb5_14930 [Anaeromicropila herbilytica]